MKSVIIPIAILITFVNVDTRTVAQETKTADPGVPPCDAPLQLAALFSGAEGDLADSTSKPLGILFVRLYTKYRSMGTFTTHTHTLAHITGSTPYLSLGLGLDQLARPVVWHRFEVDHDNLDAPRRSKRRSVELLKPTMSMIM